MALTTQQMADLRSDIGLKNQYLVAILGKPTGGTFTLTYNAQTTAAIPYNATAAVVQAALEALPYIDLGGVYVTGTEILKDVVGSPYNLVFAVDEGLVLSASAAGLTGGTSPSISIATRMAFSNAELQRFYSRAEADVLNGLTDDTYALARYYALWAMFADAHKYHNYTANQDAQNKQQIFLNIEKLLDKYGAMLGIVDGVWQTISVGTLSLAIDTSCDDLTEWANEANWCD